MLRNGGDFWKNPSKKNRNENRKNRYNHFQCIVVSSSSALEEDLDPNRGRGGVVIFLTL